MSATEALAIIGTVTGVTGAALGVLAFIRDRARLVVRWTGYPHPGEANQYFLIIWVINAGRQPIAVINVGINNYMRRSRVRFTARIGGVSESDYLGEYLDGYDILSMNHDAPVVVKPGELATFTVKGEGLRPWHDQPLDTMVAIHVLPALGESAGVVSLLPGGGVYAWQHESAIPTPETLLRGASEKQSPGSR